MPKIWSELRVARLEEQLADLATLTWLVIWGTAAWQLFQLLASFAETGRTVRAGGQSLVRAGSDLAGALTGLPLVGPGLGDVARSAFAEAGGPLSAFGTELEQLILVIAIVLALLLALVMLVPWLAHYLPWRWARLRRVRDAHRAIRVAPSISDPALERLLAMRAVSRLEYSALLAYTPDPLGDWETGRLDRLARAELASGGLATR